MPLVPCRECGKEISSIAKNCPYCGVPDPGLSGSGKLIIHRNNAWVSRLPKMRIFINGNEICSLAVNETKVLNLDAGIYDVCASFPLSGKSDPYRIKIRSGEERKLEATATWDLASNGKPKIEES